MYSLSNVHLQRDGSYRHRGQEIETPLSSILKIGKDQLSKGRQLNKR